MTRGARLRAAVVERHRDEAGTTVLWLLGLSMCLLLVSGMALDLWRGIAQHRELTALADSAAIAAASGIDEAHARATGTVRLDVAAAATRAHAVLAAHADGSDLRARARLTIVGDEVTLELHDTVTFTLLRFVVPSTELSVTARARPVVRP